MDYSAIIAAAQGSGVATGKPCEPADKPTRAAGEQPGDRPAQVSPDAAIEARIGALEARVEQQEAALRHVIAMLIELFEEEGASKAA